MSCFFVIQSCWYFTAVSHFRAFIYSILYMSYRSLPYFLVQYRSQVDFRILQTIAYTEFSSIFHNLGQEFIVYFPLHVNPVDAVAYLTRIAEAAITRTVRSSLYISIRAYYHRALSTKLQR